MSVLPQLEEKPRYVERMFARIASGYDRMNRIMTFGLDQGWRRFAVEQVAPPAFGRSLDVGTGTGDFLPMLADWSRNGTVVGADFTVPMMRAGQARVARVAPDARFVAGDALHLPFADASFDAIVTGFTLRNVADIDQALRELWRVARPGGRMACLEVARPRNPFVRLGHRFYFEQVVPRLATLLGADTDAYTYLPQSARAFPPPERLAAMMEAAGWRQARYRLLGLGAVAVHTAVKPISSGERHVV